MSPQNSDIIYFNDDILIYFNEELQISTEPLKDHLLTIELPHELETYFSGYQNGYAAKWIIDQKKLFLIEWKGYILDCIEVGIDYLFPDEDFVFAFWFSGKIRVMLKGIVKNIYGQEVVTVHAGNRFLVFEKGILVDEFVEEFDLHEIEKRVQEEERLPF